MYVIEKLCILLCSYKIVITKWFLSDVYCYINVYLVIDLFVFS